MNIKPHVADAIVHSHHVTVHVFEKYGHILYFVPLAYDHMHDLYGACSAGAIVYCMVAALVAKA